jgi:hypothetical protein
MNIFYLFALWQNSYVVKAIDYFSEGAFTKKGYGVVDSIRLMVYSQVCKLQVPDGHLSKGGFESCQRYFFSLVLQVCPNVLWVTPMRHLFASKRAVHSDAQAKAE